MSCSLGYSGEGHLLVRSSGAKLPIELVRPFGAGVLTIFLASLPRFTNLALMSLTILWMH